MQHWYMWIYLPLQYMCYWRYMPYYVLELAFPFFFFIFSFFTGSFIMNLFLVDSYKSKEHAKKNIIEFDSGKLKPYPTGCMRVQIIKG